MNLPLDPMNDPVAEDIAAEAQKQQQPAAEAGSADLSGAGEVLGTAVEIVADGTAEGVIDVVGDAVGGLFSLFD